LYIRKSHTNNWIKGPNVILTKESDWTATAHIASLEPQTEYEYAWMNLKEDAMSLVSFSVTGRRSDRLVNVSDSLLYKQTFKLITWPLDRQATKMSFAFGTFKMNGNFSLSFHFSFNS
jgi:hypothetical protein